MTDPRALVAPILMAAGIACLVVAGFSRSARAAEDTPPPRVWVLWDETSNTAWLSPKGHTATSTTATACALATVEAARYSPAGTRLACRKTTSK